MNYRKWLVISGAMTATFVAVMAFVHTPQGLRVYSQMRGSKSCPYGMDAAATPQVRDAHRALESASLRGEGRARSMRFLGFNLNHTKRSEVDVWIASKNAICHNMHGISSDLECKLPSHLGAPQGAQLEGTVFFTFDGHDLLKSVHLMTHYPDAQSAAEAFAELRDAATGSIGAKPTQKGESSSDYLSVNVLRQVAAEFHLEDVYARLSATHMPVSYIVEQKYRALAD